MKLKDKVAIVTGGASGLGEATVRLFVSLGVKVAIFDLNESAGNKLVSELGSNSIFCKTDVTSEPSVKESIETCLKSFGGLHICCNYAGIAIGAKTYDARSGAHPLDKFKKVIEINLVGTFNVARLAAEAMAKNEPVTEDGQRGVIINTASVAAYEGQIGQVAYSASKGGVVGMNLVIARDLAKLGIRCNTIVPGLIHTPMFDGLPIDVVKGLSASVLNPQRLGRPDEIAITSQFIIENDYVNGECIRLDGGIRMQPR